MWTYESTNLWWIKTDIPRIRPTTSEVWSVLGDVTCQSIHVLCTQGTTTTLEESAHQVET